MVSTLNVTFNFVYMLNSHWPFGELYCKISQFIAVLSVCASVFSLMSISIDSQGNLEAFLEKKEEKKRTGEGRTERQEEKEKEVFKVSKKTARSPEVEEKTGGKWKKH
ncbi:hypothetical protein GEV33_002820 [Tenebrio molitor]|uniref:G-protein coupled receptors family 1 profile domain-containing protein n=1 Tax=Tenebrio molitor TaxID=7067 RepID=A0A8J6HU48_TENMO|nr:hypothetical protein GEV33_002820 [Tenebrio molitor]